MKDFIRIALTGVLSLGKMKNRIVFESNPDLADNAWPVFKYFLDMGLDSRYELCWLVGDKARYEGMFPGRNVSFVEYDAKSKVSRLGAASVLLHSKCVVFCNKTVWSPRPGQLSLFLGHGSPIKTCRGIYTPGGFCNRWTYTAESLKDIMIRELGLDPNQGELLGFPRNDALLEPFGALDRVIDRKGRKVIFWLPTFRRHKVESGCNYELPGCGLPLLGEEGALLRLNEALQKNNVMIVLKPHPVQDMSAVHAADMSNFCLIDDEMLQKANVRLYEALADADALMTDYSSVYYDYLITGKPIALTFDDLEKYSGSRGFVFEDIKTEILGRTVTDEGELFDFIAELNAGEDKTACARAMANARFNHYSGGSTKAVADYILNFLSKDK